MLFNKLSISAFLRDYFKNLPKRGYGESSRIAHHLRVSTTLVSQVLGGDKFFTPEQVQNLVAYLGLAPLEADYLSYLNQFERSASQELRAFWRRKLEEIREKSLQLSNRVQKDKTLNEHEKSVFYSNPLFSAIRLFTSTATKGKSLDEVCERFQLSRANAAAMLSFLVQQNLCYEAGGKFFMGVQKTHLEKSAPQLIQHHTNWRVHALKYATELSDSELQYTAPVSLSRKDFDSLREKMVLFIQEFLKQVHDSPAEDVACLNLDFFWVRK